MPFYLIIAYHFFLHRAGQEKQGTDSKLLPEKLPRYIFLQVKAGLSITNRKRPS